MAIYHTDCTPYLSATLFHVSEQDADLTRQLRKAIADALRPAGSQDKQPVPVARRFSMPAPPHAPPEGMEIAWLHYEEKRSPSWYAADRLKDTHHHLAIVCRKDRLAALCFSDSAARSAVVRTIAKAAAAPFCSLKRLSPAEIEAAFVEDRVRTLWLSGAHRRSLIKPDAKVLSGLELESALDPLGDQTYYFSSVRSTSSNEQLAASGRSAVIGASPRHARIWIGPTRSWDEFISRMALLMDQAADKMAGELPRAPAIPVLARPASGIDGVEQPYDMAIIVPELALAGIDHDDGEERWLQQFGDAARFEISATAGSADFEADVFWGEERLGRLAYEFAPRDGGDVHLRVEKRSWGQGEGRQQDLLKICRNPDYLTIYFDTGHSYARGQFYRTQFRDAQFLNWRLSLT